MAEIYYYIPAKEADYVVECGLKLSKWFDKEVLINGEQKKCISALLNPKDDMEKYKSSEYKCVKFEILPNYCFVADRYLYEVGKNSERVMDMYTNTITPIQDYKFGIFRAPECLVTVTVIAEQISVLDKRIDSPILFDSSEELYTNNIIEAYREAHHDFNDAMLYYFYCMLAENSKVDKIEDRENKIAIFVDKIRGKTVTIKIPELSKY